MDLLEWLQAGGAALLILLAVIAGLAAPFYLFERLRPDRRPAQAARRESLRRAWAAWAEPLGLRVDPSEPRVSGYSWGEPFELSYVPPTDLVVLRLSCFPPEGARLLEFELRRGWFGGLRLSGPCAARARPALAAQALQSQLHELLGPLGWSEVELQHSLLTARGPRARVEPLDADRLTAVLSALSRLGLALETGGLWLAPSYEQIAVCPYCRGPLQPSEARRPCPACGTVLHEECWSENAGCAVFGCGEAGHGRRRPGEPVQE